MKIKKAVLVAGAGISGKNACRLLLEKGVEAVLYDGNTGLSEPEIRCV